MKALLINYFHPPSTTGGARRFSRLLPHLREQGWEVHVLTTNRHGTLPDDSRNFVERIPEIFANGPGNAVAAPSKIGPWIFPDTRYYKFGLPAYAKAIELHGKHKYDLLITTSSPESSHLIGRRLKKRTGIPWIADFRDGWMFEPPADIPALLRPLHALLEKKIVFAADGIVAATAPIARNFEKRYPGIKTSVITNSFQAAGQVAVKSANASEKVIAHIGQLSLSSRHCRIESFLQALDESRDALKGKVRFVFAGRFSFTETKALERHRDLIELRGSLNAKDCADLAKQADLFLLVTDPVRKSVLTAKLLDYFEAGKPVFALAKDNAAAAAIKSTNTGFCADPENVSEIAAGLKRIAAGEFSYAPDAAEMRRYSSTAVAREYAALMTGTARK